MHHILHIFKGTNNQWTDSEESISIFKRKQQQHCCNVFPAASYVCCIIHEHMTPVSVLQNYFFLHRSWIESKCKASVNMPVTSMRKSPILRPALHATPPSSTDSRYCSAGNAGVGVNSSMGVWAVDDNKTRGSPQQEHGFDNYAVIERLKCWLNN